MNKRGQVVEAVAVISFLIVSGVFIYGTYLVNTPPSGFVGDITIRHYYNFDCISKIKQENRIVFTSDQSAKTLNFSYSTC